MGFPSTPIWNFLTQLVPVQPSCEYANEERNEYVINENSWEHSETATIIFFASFVVRSALSFSVDMGSLWCHFIFPNRATPAACKVPPHWTVNLQNQLFLGSRKSPTASTTWKGLRSVLRVSNVFNSSLSERKPSEP